MAGNGGRYDIALDPLWNGEAEPDAEPFGKDEIAFYQCDHLGTPQELTDCRGKVAWSAQYKAWGQAKEAISGAAYKSGIRNPIRFQGQYLDEETGLHYNRYRYYDPLVGRFVSADPIGLTGGSNLFAYAPNPTEWADPLGLKKHCGKTYRALTEAQEETVKNNLPLLPKSTNNPHTPQEHVENGKNRTQFMSTSKSLARAKFYAKRRGAKIAEIDLCKIPDHQIVDISDENGSKDNPKKKQFAKAWAVKDEEVLIRGPIPPAAYKLL